MCFGCPPYSLHRMLHRVCVCTWCRHNLLAVKRHPGSAEGLRCDETYWDDSNLPAGCSLALQCQPFEVNYPVLIG